MRLERVPAAPWLVAALSAVLLGACEFNDGLARHPPVAPPPPAAPTPDAVSTAALLDMVIALQESDPAHQAEIFQAAKDAADLTPTTSNQLRYAMALATPAHAGADAVAAQRHLSELLARPDTLLPLERALAIAQLKEVEQRLILQAENARLRDEALHESRDRQQSMSRRLQAEIDENARLHKALDEAQAKLDAVTHIERSINDRAPRGPVKQ